MSCCSCQIFLQDFLQAGVSRDLDLYKQMRIHCLSRVLSELVPWFYKVYLRIDKKAFEKARQTALKISSRGRKLYEYDYLIHTATINLLKHEIPWIENEIQYMKVVLAESGLFKGKQYFVLLSRAQDFLTYILSCGILCLNDIHEDHKNPKGLMTNITTVTQRHQELLHQMEDEKECETVYDSKDDYQKEILLEISLDDLYF